MMQHLEVLLFLLFPGLVLGQNCLTNHAVENFGLDVNNTAIANTTVEIIAELEDWSNDTCITACCNTHESANCTIAEFDSRNKTCRLYKSNCKLNETCILKQAVNTTLTFIKKHASEIDSPKSSNNDKADTNAKDATNKSSEKRPETANDSNSTINATRVASNATASNSDKADANAKDSTNTTKTSENIPESANDSNSTINATLLASNATTSNKNESVSNTTHDRMTSETEFNVSNSSTNKTDVSNPEINSTDNPVNTTKETHVQHLSNTTNELSTETSEAKGINGSEEIPETHIETHITSIAPNVNNTVNDTKPQPTPPSAMPIISNQSITVTEKKMETPSANSSVSSNSAQNTTKNIPATPLGNTTIKVPSNGSQNIHRNNTLQDNRTSTARPVNDTEVNNTANMITLPSGASSFNSTINEKTNNSRDELMTQRTNETAEQSNMTKQISINTTVGPEQTSEKTIKVASPTVGGNTTKMNGLLQIYINTTVGPVQITEKAMKVASPTAGGNTTKMNGLLQLTEAPAFTAGKTTTTRNNTTSTEKESLSNTTHEHGMSKIPVTNITKATSEVATSKDEFSKQNITSPTSIPEGHTTTETNTSTATIQPQLRFHYPHFESPESAAISGALIAAVSFGVMFLFSVLVLVGKRCFDSWQRRHYSRMDYLINGMYN